MSIPLKFKFAVCTQDIEDVVTIKAISPQLLVGLLVCLGYPGSPHLTPHRGPILDQLSSKYFAGVAIGVPGRLCSVQHLILVR